LDLNILARETAAQVAEDAAGSFSPLAFEIYPAFHQPRSAHKFFGASPGKKMDE